MIRKFRIAISSRRPGRGSHSLTVCLLSQNIPGCKEHLFKTTQEAVERENRALNKGPTPITEVHKPATT